MNNFIENRYPFEGAFEFFSLGYAFQEQARHLLAGWLVVTLATILVSKIKDLAYSEKCAILYFSLSLYNNPCFELYGIEISEWFGIIGSALFIFQKNIFNRQAIPLAIVATIFIFWIHNIIIYQLYPELNYSTDILQSRILVNLKLVVVALGLVALSKVVEHRLDVLIKAIVLTTTASIFLYFLQAYYYYSGTTPYGTYADAGFSGIPSFGSVSIERGHYAKFMAPIFPFFVYAFTNYRSKLYLISLIMFAVVMTLNFSASGQAFFYFSIILTLLVYRSRIRLFGILAIGYFLLAAGALVYSIFPQAISGVFNKIFTLAIQGDETSGGGRSLGVFMDYINSYPWGIGYGGSTLRTAPGLTEINSGVFSFVSQVSFLSLFFILAYMVLIFKTVRIALYNRLMLPKNRPFLVGVMLAPLMFFSDILWFMPMIWISYHIIWVSNPDYASRRR